LVATLISAPPSALRVTGGKIQLAGAGPAPDNEAAGLSLYDRLTVAPVDPRSPPREIISTRQRERPRGDHSAGSAPVRDAIS
jgi:hypothetical protein